MSRIYGQQRRGDTVKHFYAAEQLFKFPEFFFLEKKIRIKIILREKKRTRNASLRLRTVGIERALLTDVMRMMMIIRLHLFVLGGYINILNRYSYSQYNHLYNINIYYYMFFYEW